MYRSILVPLDGSGFGEHALPLALSIARRAGAALRLVHVHAPFWGGPESGAYPDDALDRHLKGRAKAYIDHAAYRVAQVSAVDVKAVLLEGEVAPTLRGLVTSTGEDLVVMTTHGRGPLRRFWLGSVADALVRDLPVPLLLVRPAEAKAELSSELVLKHVLLPLDGTPLAEQMIEPAVALGSLTDADYTLLRVVRPGLPPTYPLEGVTLDQLAEAAAREVEERERRLREYVEEYLVGVAAGLRVRGLRVQTRAVVDPQPAIAILREGAAPACDLIALATHARRGLSRFVLGSVADKVIRGAAVPVLVQRPAYE